MGEEGGGQRLCGAHNQVNGWEPVVRQRQSCLACKHVRLPVPNLQPVTGIQTPTDVQAPISPNPPAQTGGPAGVRTSATCST